MDARKEVAVADIEDELISQWDLEESRDKVKAGLFNLIVYSPDRSEQTFIENISWKVTHKFPCRVIFATQDPSITTESLHTYIQVEKIGDPHLMVGCDQIFIEFSPLAKKQVPFLILPHLLPDLPLYLLWTGNIFSEKELFTALAPIASRIILHPNQLENFANFIQMVLSLDDWTQADIVDFNWTLSDEWREIIGSCMDCEERLSQLPNLKSVRISYAGAGQSALLPALYLQGWLATQLNWKFVQIERQTGGYRLTYSHEQQELYVTLVENKENSQLTPGAIQEVEMASRSEYIFNFRLNLVLQQVKVMIWSKEKCDIPYTVPLIHSDPDQAFANEIFQKGSSPHYKNMLQMLLEIDFKEFL